MQRQVSRQGLANAVRTPRQQLRPRVAPYLGASKVLDRPYESLSGRRHVPILVNANRVPMLRFKKPQSPFLSRIIRDQVKTRESRILVSNELAAALPVAQAEDTWDRILVESFGLHQDKGEESWRFAIEQAQHELYENQDAAIKKRKAIAERMHKIVEEEKVLAEAEKLRLRDEKHKARKARRPIGEAKESLAGPDQVDMGEPLAPVGIVEKSEDTEYAGVEDLGNVWQDKNPIWTH